MPPVSTLTGRNSAAIATASGARTTEAGIESGCPLHAATDSAPIPGVIREKDGTLLPRKRRKGLKIQEHNSQNERRINQIDRVSRGY